MKATVCAKCPCVVAESPRYCESDHALYWVDVTAGDVYRLRDGNPPDAFERFSPGLGKIGAVHPLGGGWLWLFTERCEVWETDFGGKPRLRWSLEGHRGRRFNDVWVDAGNAFCGVAGSLEEPGELWLLRDGSFSSVERATRGNPNGMGVSPDGRTFYFVVTDERRIYAYDYDRATGRVSNRRVLCDDFPGEGMPDGMTVDPRDGSLWVAMWDGSRLEHRDAAGRLLESVPFPMKKVSSVEIACGRLFVTTANKDRSPETYRRQTGAGAVFSLDPHDVQIGYNT